MDWYVKLTKWWIGWPLIEKRLVSSGMRPFPWVERTGDVWLEYRTTQIVVAHPFHKDWSFRFYKTCTRGTLIQESMKMRLWNFQERDITTCCIQRNDMVANRNTSDALANRFHLLQMSYLPRDERNRKYAYYTPSFVSKDDGEETLINTFKNRNSLRSVVDTSGSLPLRVYSSVWQMPIREGHC